MSGKPDPHYRRAVGVMLLNREGLVWIGRRSGEVAPSAGGYLWQMPQGGVDAGEDLLAAARRELHEETNVTSAELLAEAPNWYAYDFPPDIKAHPKYGKHRGQTQKWFAFRFTGAESEINVLHPGGGEKAEFDAWRWVEMAELPSLIVPFKRGVYDQVVAAFAHLAG